MSKLPESDLDEATLARIAQETDQIVDPRTVAAERININELPHVLGAIASELTKGRASARWDKRIQLLVRLQGILNGFPPSQRNIAAGYFTKLHDALVTQLLDLRSKVVGVAGATVAHIGMIFGEAAVTLISELMPTLLKQASGTNKVVAGSAIVASKSIIRAVPNITVLSGVLAQLRDAKNANMTDRCAELILTALQSWHPSVFDGTGRGATMGPLNLDDIANAVKNCVMAASSEARSYGLSSFEILKKQWPAVADRLQRSAGVSAQKRFRPADMDGGSGSSQGRKKVAKLTASRRMALKTQMKMKMRMKERNADEFIVQVVFAPGRASAKSRTPRTSRTPRRSIKAGGSTPKMMGQRTPRTPRTPTTPSRRGTPRTPRTPATATRRTPRHTVVRSTPRRSGV